MPNTEIFYFSGSGNSLAVAKDISQELNGKLTHVSVLQGTDAYKSDAETVGFVFPIYDFIAPSILSRNIKKVEGLKDKYIFAVCTYGIAPKKSLRDFEETIELTGGTLSSSFSVLMPHNGVGNGVLTEKQQARMINDWLERRDDVCKMIAERQKNDSMDIRSGSSILRILKMVPTLVRFVWRVVTKGIDSLKLSVDDTCNGCAICARICPVANIEMSGGKPKWLDNCAGCFGCMHWCPKNSISLGGFDANIKHYHHPSISFQEMNRNE